MASSTGTSQNSSSDEDQRKRKRMLSNRESARRSRMRKQKHLEDMTAQVHRLNKENSEILKNINVTTQFYVNLETDNSILRVQMAELSHRLDSLNEIINCMNSRASDHGRMFETYHHDHVNQTAQINFEGGFMNSWNGSPFVMNQVPIMADDDHMMLI